MLLRQYYQWIYTNCPHNMVWLAIDELNKIMNHDNTIVKYRDREEKIDKYADTVKPVLQYVNTCHFDDNKITILFTASKGYYLVHNERETNITSTIWYDDELPSLVERLPSKIRKHVSLKTISKIKLGDKDKQKLELVQPYDFVNQVDQVELWKKYLSQRQKETILDLSGFYMFDPMVIIRAGVRSNNFHTIIVNQNQKFSRNDWLYYFPNLRTYTLWYSKAQNDDFAKLHQYAPKITTLEFHNCLAINGRVLLNVTRLPSLERLIINNDRCELQSDLDKTIISDEEWGSLRYPTLHTLLIDSGNLTMDFIKFALISFPCLEHFVMHEKVLAKFGGSSSSGEGDHEVTFHSASNLQNSIVRKGEIKVWNLVRNKYGKMFSESMLKKIKTIDPSKTNAADDLLKK
jgi:hypothetical protein